MLEHGVAGTEPRLPSQQEFGPAEVEGPLGSEKLRYGSEGQLAVEAAP